jgi:hypothetical protein
MLFKLERDPTFYSRPSWPPRPPERLDEFGISHWASRPDEAFLFSWLVNLSQGVGIEAEAIPGRQGDSAVLWRQELQQSVGDKVSKK